MKLVKEQKLELVGFLTVCILLWVWLISCGSMNETSGDANDIWRTITTWYSSERYASYVLYKGFLSVYPYVWLYQLAVLFKTNDFLFVMLYHAVLFSYITFWGTPNIVHKLTGWKPQIWQRLLLCLVSYVAWKPTGALNQIMVDLPSCALFIMASESAIRISESQRKLINSLISGILCGLCAFISGQYIIASICILILSCIQISGIGGKKQKIMSWGLLILGFLLIKGINDIFNYIVIGGFAEKGIFIVSGDAWLHRGLVYMLNIPRMDDLHSVRGDAILQDYFGYEEGMALWNQAAQGGYTWNLSQYFRVVIKYPLDFVLQYFDRLFLCLSIDKGANCVKYLIGGYSMVYLWIVTLRQRMKSFSEAFNRYNLIILGAVFSVAAVLVLAVEFRYAMTLHSIIWGVALTGPIIPSTLKGMITNKKKICDRKFPWNMFWGIVFCVGCLAYYNSFYCQTYTDPLKILLHF